MSIKVIVNGASGKMGSLACTTIRNQPQFELVAGLTRQDDLHHVIKDTKADIVVDFTTAESVYSNSLAVIESNTHPVIGTSGLDKEQIRELTELSESKQLGGIIVPNFSLGAVLMMRFAQEAARYLSEVEIIEAHHQEKFDAPSGTAFKTAEMIASVRKKKNDVKTHDLCPGVRGGVYQGVNIHSLRLPGVLANQQVIFGNTGETLSIHHSSIDRNCFMPGLLLCCQQVMKLKTLYYGLETILE